METIIMGISEIIMKSLFSVLLFCTINVILIYAGKIIFSIIKQNHERKIKKLEFEQRKEWEIFIHKIECTKRDSEIEIDKLAKEISNLKNQISELPDYENLDMNRIALLHLLLSGKDGISVDNMEKETDKIKKTYETLKNFMKK